MKLHPTPLLTGLILQNHPYNPFCLSTALTGRSCGFAYDFRSTPAYEPIMRLAHTTLALAALFALEAHAHCALSWPPPLRAVNNPFIQQVDVGWSQLLQAC